MSLLHLKTLVTSATLQLCMYTFRVHGIKGYHEVTVATVEHYTLSFIPMNLPLFTQSAQIHMTIERRYNESQWKSSLSQIKYYYFVERRFLF